jgi:hypothetical protein
MAPSLVLLFALAPACSDYAVKGNSDVLDGADDGGEPDIEVTPTDIDFGAMDVGGDVTAIETVEVKNVGGSSLSIQSVGLEDTSQPFTISAISSVLIEPGASASFTVAFEPLTATDSATDVVIMSNDPDEAESLVHLAGTGVAPVIKLDPASYDFGSLYIGCEGELPLTIKNDGNAPLIVSDFDYVSASTDLVFDPMTAVNGDLPWTIAPQESVQVGVGYVPYDDYADDGYLKVTSNDPFQPIAQASQTAAASLYGQNTDVFQQPIQGQTDIVFTLDWSCSMSTDIARVQANFDVFVATLGTMDADYHVAVVTDDDGCVNGSQPYVDNTMSAADQTALFDTMVNSYTYGAYTEMGFTLAEAAFSADNLASGGCNEGLIRDDATLAIVGVTDEVEQSANPWSYYVSLFQGMKADPDDVVFHAIAGDYPSGCGDNEAGLGWYEATVATGGLFLSICATDWASHLEAIAEGSAADLSSFELTQWPVPETIVVRVDGINQTTGWTYNGTDNTVDFDELSIPEGGSTVEVDYALYGSCDG